MLQNTLIKRCAGHTIRVFFVQEVSEEVEIFAAEQDFLVIKCR